MSTYMSYASVVGGNKTPPPKTIVHTIADELPTDVEPITATPIAATPIAATPIADEADGFTTRKRKPKKQPKQVLEVGFHFQPIAAEVPKPAPMPKPAPKSAPRPAPTPQTYYKTRMCKFGNQCFRNQNGTCTFAHSKKELVPLLCRFGADCRRSTCTFEHPDPTDPPIIDAYAPCKWGVGCNRYPDCKYGHPDNIDEIQWNGR